MSSTPGPVPQPKCHLRAGVRAYSGEGANFLLHGNGCLPTSLMFWNPHLNKRTYSCKLSFSSTCSHSYTRMHTLTHGHSLTHAHKHTHIGCDVRNSAKRLPQAYPMKIIEDDLLKFKVQSCIAAHIWRPSCLEGWSRTIWVQKFSQYNSVSKRELPPPPTSFFFIFILKVVSKVLFIIENIEHKFLKQNGKTCLVPKWKYHVTPKMKDFRNKERGSWKQARDQLWIRRACLLSKPDALRTHRERRTGSPELSYDLHPHCGTIKSTLTHKHITNNGNVLRLT